MQTFFTSDLHFGHTNVIKYCNRPFASSAEMDEALIYNWNNRVSNDDRIYVLGDVFFCNESRAKYIMGQLNGEKLLVPGNHDRMIRRATPIQKLFDKILPDLHETTIDDTYVVMCHYPLVSWNRSYYGSFMLHGHCHNALAFDDSIRRLDVGVDAHDFKPVSWSEVKLRLDNIPKTKNKDI